MSRCVLRKTPGLTMILCSLALTPAWAAKKNLPPDRTVTVKLPAPPKLKQIQGDDRIVHALDRLTFGPRPGEIDQVKAMGLEVWINQQLHPANIDDTAMEQRLQQFPAMRLREEELTHKFPPGSIIRQVENGKISVPLFNATSAPFMKTR